MVIEAEAVRAAIVDCDHDEAEVGEELRPTAVYPVVTSNGLIDTNAGHDCVSAVQAERKGKESRAGQG